MIYYTMKGMDYLFKRLVSLCPVHYVHKRYYVHRIIASQGVI